MVVPRVVLPLAERATAVLRSDPTETVRDPGLGVLLLDSRPVARDPDVRGLNVGVELTLRPAESGEGPVS